MARGTCTFRQRDAKAAAKAMLDLGLEISRVEFERDGKIVVIVGKPESQKAPEGGGEEIVL